MRAVFFSGSPKKEAGPVMEATKPILMGSAAQRIPKQDRLKRMIAETSYRLLFFTELLIVLSLLMC
jgi:hypothetical protein